MKPVAISVLLCVFNERPPFLCKSIESILNQTFTEFEFIIIDDGSTDRGTLDILQHFADADDRIRRYTFTHRGLTVSLNEGILYCTAPLIARQDSDDWSEPERLARQLTFFNDHTGTVLAGTQVNICREDGKRLWRYSNPLVINDVYTTFRKFNPFIHGSCCFRKDAVLEVGGYREDLRYAQDYDLFWRLCERGGGANLPEVLYNLRCTANSISAVRAVEQEICRLTVVALGEMRHVFGREDWVVASSEASSHFRSVDRLAYGFLEAADRNMYAGRFFHSLLLYLRGLIRSPMSLRGYLKLLRFFCFVLFPFFRTFFMSQGNRSTPVSSYDSGL